jgi:ferredoxin-NADP reductase
MMEFEAVIRTVIPRTHNVKSFRFEKPAGFDYLAGQYIFVAIPVDGVVRRKPFTLSSSPSEDHLEFTKKLTGHEFSNTLDSMNEGDSLRITGPYGNLTFTGEYERVALVSGGIGITPMISICKYCTDLKIPSDIVVLSSNRTEEDIVFRDELARLESENPHLRVIHTLSRAEGDWSGCRGRICDTMIMQAIPDYAERVFYLCGPPAMVDSVKAILKQMHIPPERMKIELFSGY